MIYHFVFFMSYIFYCYIFFENTKKFLYPVFLYPFIIYIFMGFVSFYLKKMYFKSFKKVFNDLSKFLIVFILFFLTPFFLKIDIPEPHNFILRKLEIFAGVLYITFIVSIVVFSFYILKAEITQNYDKNFLFKNIIIIFFIFYFFISLWLNYANQPTGDEPIYLLVSHSIINDRDIDLKNNYEKKDYRKFYPNRELQSQELEINGKLYSYHPVFYSLLISPFYMFGGRLGVTIFSNILAALILGFIFLLFCEVFSDKKIIFWITVFTGFSMPFIMYINQICTENLNNLLILISFYLIIFNKNKLLNICLIMALIPWAHFRNFIIWFCLILIFIIENKNEINKILKFFFSQIISILFLFVFNYIHYNSFIPRQTKEELSFFDSFKFRIEGILGLLLDQEFGLFFYTPIFIFVFAGAYFLYKENKKVFCYILLLLLPYYLFLSSWILWNGGGGASNRFLVSVIFTFVMLVIPIFVKVKDKISLNIIYATLIFSLFISFIIISIPWFRWNKGFGENWILKIISDISKINISDLFPSLWHHPKENVIQIIIWLFVILFFNILIIRRSRRG